MVAVIFGFLGVVVSAILILLVLNYSMFLWENGKISDLTSKIKSEPEDNISDLLSKNNTSRGFTTRDLNENIVKNRAISKVNQEDRKVIFVDEEIQSQLLNSIIVFFKKFRVNFWAQIRSIYRYFIHLAKPTKIDKEKLNQDEHQAQVTEVIEKVKTAESQEEYNNSNSEVNQVVVVTPKKSTTSDDDAKEQELFETMENKLLAKLKEVGMKHFDIWLDLGKLYEKHNYKEKAIEIYSMILKHADGKEKEFAKDKLIEMT